MFVREPLREIVHYHEISLLGIGKTIYDTFNISSIDIGMRPCPQGSPSPARVQRSLYGAVFDL